MTYFQEEASPKANRINLFARFSMAFFKGVKRAARTRPTQRVAMSETNIPKSGMPVSNEVVTRLGIRAGFTAGSW